MLPERSRVVRVHGRGGPEVLRVELREVLEPGPREVRIATEVCGVAYGDVMRRHGVLAPGKPFTPGYDVVGRVDARGTEADPRWTLGQRVAALAPGPGFGGYADHLVVDADRLVAVPDRVDSVTAVALGLNYITAWQLIHRMAALAPGQRVLVHGAAGGVGIAVLDLAGLPGIELETYGTASAAKHEHLRARGCTAIDYRSEDFVARMAALCPAGVDAVFDGIGGAHLTRSAQVLRRRGTLVALGVSGDVEAGIFATLAGTRHFVWQWFNPKVRARSYAITLSRGCGWDACRDDWARLLAMAAEGQLRPHVAAQLPLDEVVEAHRLLDERAVVGKLVLTT